MKIVDEFTAFRSISWVFVIFFKLSGLQVKYFDDITKYNCLPSEIEDQVLSLMIKNVMLGQTQFCICMYSVSEFKCVKIKEMFQKTLCVLVHTAL